ncbi:MAG: hypothetical protein ACK5SA_02770 [Planctomycetota bacterium]
MTLAVHRLEHDSSPPSQKAPRGLRGSSSAEQDAGDWGIQNRETLSQIEPDQSAPSLRFQSLPFRIGAAVASWVKVGFGLFSLWVLLAIAAAVPVVQFASFGYLLAASGRVALTGKLSSGLFGWNRAAHLGGILLGGWLSLLPVRILSDSWYTAWLIEPASSQTRSLRVSLIGLMILTGVHLLGALACGGKLRHFLWPLVAPGRWLSWLLQGAFRWPVARRLVDESLGRLFPRLIADIRSLRPLADWFPPVVLAKSIGKGNWLAQSSRDLWDFGVGLQLPSLWWLGVRGAAGTLLWLLVPSGLLIAAANRNDAGGGLLALLGIPLAACVFALLLSIQLRFAASGKWRAFLEPGAAWAAFRRAPFWLTLCGWVALIMALPMFFLKIEAVPPELESLLALMFVAGSWPSRLLLGWAGARSNAATKPRAWWWSLLWFTVLVIGCGAFAVILLLTRYLSWSGAGSLLENHLFLLPTPFWLK